MKTLTYSVLLERDDEAGGWTAKVPALPACFTQGETKGETLANAKECIQLHITGLLEEGLPVPEETHPLVLVEQVEVED